MKAAGFDYGKTDSWIEKFGVREQIIRETKSLDVSNDRSRGTKIGTKTGHEERPGISPALFAEQLLNCAVFLHLEDVAEALPPITEIPTGIDMSPDLYDGYKKLESDIKSVMDKQLAQGNRRLLGRYLISVLTYPDKPFENEPIDLDDGGFAYPRALLTRPRVPKRAKAHRDSAGEPGTRAEMPDLSQLHRQA